jgi:hypothetical protein
MSDKPLGVQAINSRSNCHIPQERLQGMNTADNANQKKPRKKDPSKKPKHTSIKKIVNQLALGATQAQVAKSVNVSNNADT